MPIGVGIGCLTEQGGFLDETGSLMKAGDHSCAISPDPPPRFVSFAQNFEDVMLWRSLGHIKSGFYIDIGAGEPEADSVTKAFYDRGWSGINIEPAEAPFGRLMAARPRDRNLRLLVGDSEGTREFFLIDGGNALSTAVSELAARHVASGWTSQAITVPVTTLRQICDQHVRSQIHFLKLDAEWSELAILRGADFTRFRPWIVLFEATPIGTGPHSYEDCDRVLEQAGYRFAYEDGLNRFWIAEERHAELACHFAVAPNVFDSFVLASEVAARDDLARTAASLDEARHRLAQMREEAAADREALVQARAALDDHRQQHDAARTVLAGQAAELVGAAAQAEALRIQLDHSFAERDIYTQELFETNRHAGQLTVERQQLLERVAFGTEQLAQAQKDCLVQAQAHAQAQKDCLAHARAQKDGLVRDYENRLLGLLGLQEQLAHARAHGDHLQGRLDAVYASTSWKFAFPVRLARRLLGK